MADDRQLRQHLVRLLDWEDAHVGFDAAITGIPDALRGVQPAGLPYSPWQLLEHLRLTQRDLLEFCQDAEYRQRRWPDDYWPTASAPPSIEAWDSSVAQVRRDREALQALANSAPDLLAAIPQGSGQTYLRELLLAADHTAYHIGQLVAVRRLLGNWGAARAT